MWTIVAILGILLSVVLLAVDTKRRRGHILYKRVIISVILIYLAALATSGQEQRFTELPYDPLSFLARYFGMLAALWFIIVRPKRTVDVLLERGVRLFSKGNAHEALTVFEQALERASTDKERASLLYNMANCHVRLDQDSSAVQALVNALEVRPSLKKRIAKDKDLQKLTDHEELRSLMESGQVAS